MDPIPIILSTIRVLHEGLVGGCTSSRITEMLSAEFDIHISTYDTQTAGLLSLVNFIVELEEQNETL